MSHFLDRLMFFKRNVDSFAGGHGVVTNESRGWEEGYRSRWAHDRIVRSTHGTNCTGSCSWKIYVKGGIVTWETQQTDYPRTRPDMPNHEPRGCSRGASYSWYLYSANRIKYPLVRSRLLKLWRQARAQQKDPVLAWQAIVEDPAKRRELSSGTRPRRLRPRELGRGQRDHRRGQYLYGQDPRAGPDHRLLADPGHVHGLLRGGHALSVAHRRRRHELLRLVLRPAAQLAADLGRADRRARERRLVQFELPRALGLERAADAHAGRPFLHRGPLQGRQVGGDLPGLQRGEQIRRPVAGAQARHRCGARHGQSAM